MLRGLLFAISLLISQLLYGQADSTSVMVRNDYPQFSTPSSKVYRAHPGWEIPVGAGIILGESVGVKGVQFYHSSLDEAGVLALDPQTINAFDRPGAYYDPAGFKDAKTTSDLIMSIAVVTPILLVIDKKIRKDWADLLGILLIAHSIDNAVFLTAISTVRRPRPVAYNPAVGMEAKIGEGKTNSFFSGHESWTAVSTFFIAKVYTDYHNIKGWKRMLIYTGAAIPPAAVGYYRVHAGDHFNTDVITGFLIGAACGIGIPELHRIKNKNKSFSMQPFFKLGANGVTLSYLIK